MIVTVNGVNFDTDSIKIELTGKVIEITENPHHLEVLSYDDGDSASDGEITEISTL
jgi:hypothetical protein